MESRIVSHAPLQKADLSGLPSKVRYRAWLITMIMQETSRRGLTSVAINPVAASAASQRNPIP